MWRYFEIGSSQCWQHPLVLLRELLVLPSDLLWLRVATALRFGSCSPVAISWCAITFFSVALAQPVEVNNGPKTKYMDVRGRIHSFDAKRINVLTEDNQAWQVNVPENTKVQVKGNAGIEWLQPQLAVRFYAEVNDRAMTADPVKKMTIFSPREFFQPMMEEAGNEGKTTQPGETEQPRDQSASSAAVQSEKEPTQQTKNQDDDQPNKLTPAERRRRRRDRSRAKVGKPGTRYYIAGIIKSFQPKKSRFVVDVGQAGVVRGSVADDVVVEVDITSHQFARPGDHILVDISYVDYGEVAGKQRPPNQLQQGTARGISITLADPAKDQLLPEGPGKKDRRERRR